MGKMNKPTAEHDPGVNYCSPLITVDTSMYFLEQFLDSPAAAAHKAHTKQKIIQKYTDLHRKQGWITSFL